MDIDIHVRDLVEILAAGMPRRSAGRHMLSETGGCEGYGGHTPPLTLQGAIDGHGVDAIGVNNYQDISLLHPIGIQDGCSISRRSLDVVGTLGAEHENSSGVKDGIHAGQAAGPPEDFFSG